MRGRRRAALGLMTAALAFAGAASCTGTTGSELVDFRAYAAGPADAPGGPLAFDTGPLGSGARYHVVLRRAVLHVGGVYLNRTRPVSGAQDTDCILPGTYVAQVTSPLDVDLLDPKLQAFPALGVGTETTAVTGEVWLTGGDVDAPDDPTVVVEVAGSAHEPTLGYTVDFTGALTIGQNRALSPSSPALPGSNPICKQRVVSPIPAAVTPKNGGYLVVRADPRALFVDVDFTDALAGTPAPGADISYQFPDVYTCDTDGNFYQALHASQGVYSFSWVQVRDDG